ncbi:MAG: hypothetical protein PVI21_02905 [Candidatus Woesebacteria bacterium]|jgi:hypothetical protein
MSRKIFAVSISAFCLLIGMTVVLCGMQAKEVAAIVRESADAAPAQTYSPVKVTPELHNHIEKVSAKTFAKNIDTIHASSRSLKMLHKTKKTANNNSHDWSLRHLVHYFA